MLDLLISGLIGALDILIAAEPQARPWVLASVATCALLAGPLAACSTGWRLMRLMAPARAALCQPAQPRDLLATITLGHYAALSLLMLVWTANTPAALVSVLLPLAALTGYGRCVRPRARSGALARACVPALTTLSWTCLRGCGRIMRRLAVGSA